MPGDSDSSRGQGDCSATDRAVAELPLAGHDAQPVTGPPRHGVADLAADDPPTIVSVSDIHGYLDAGRQSLLAPSAHEDYPPLVSQDEDGLLHWAEENYVLVFNGDLVDRGPDSDGVLAMAARLLEEAPPGRVRITLGNHEMGYLTPARFGWEEYYTGQTGTAGREAFLEQIRDGHVIAAYEGYNVIFAHAGQPKPFSVEQANEELISVADRLSDVVVGGADHEVQHQVIEDHPLVLGLGGVTGRGPGAGITWLDFEHLPPDAPRQVVGHTRHDRPTAKGRVLCQNVIHNNLRVEWGEAVVLESPDEVLALRRTRDGGVTEKRFDLCVAEGADSLEAGVDPDQPD